MQQTNHKKEILLTKFYQYPIEEVWEALTTKQALSKWLMKTDDLKLEIGHHFHFKAEPKPGFDGIVKCKILEIDPPNMISYTWQGGANENPYNGCLASKKVG